MPQSERMRAQVASAILEAAAAVIAERGEAASMADVAAAAGVGRATLYRYFDSREQLIRALSAAAIDEVEFRLGEANLEGVPVRLAIERATRAIVTVGTKFAFVMEDRKHVDELDVKRRIGTPIGALFRRGVADGSLRDDLSADLLAQFWGGLLETVLRSPGHIEGGVEQASAAITSLFLQGAERR